MINIKRNQEIEELKDIITNIFICYNNLTSKKAIENRNTDDIIQYKEQLNTDNSILLSIRNNALVVFDKCNSLLKE
jgi:hypothetical protein